MQTALASLQPTCPRAETRYRPGVRFLDRCLVVSLMLSLSGCGYQRARADAKAEAEAEFRKQKEEIAAAEANARKEDEKLMAELEAEAEQDTCPDGQSWTFKLGASTLNVEGATRGACDAARDEAAQEQGADGDKPGPCVCARVGKDNDPPADPGDPLGGL